MSEKISDDLITVDEAAARMRCTRQGLYKRIRSGVAPQPIKLGRRTYFLGSEVEAKIREAVEGPRPFATKGGAGHET
jgi:predicted DNA-binding transcriptional regulator AlpA